MANSARHAGIKPVRLARYSFAVTFPNPDEGTPSVTAEVSKDGGAFAATTETPTVISGGLYSGTAWITLTGAEMDASLVVVRFSSGLPGMPSTYQFINPLTFAQIASGTASAGSSSTITLAASAVGYEGAIIRTTGGTGGGGTGGANNQVAIVTSVSGNQCFISPNWETNPDATTLYAVLRTPEMGSSGSTPPTAAENADAVWDELRSGHAVSGSFAEFIDAAISSRLAPTTAGRTLDVSTGGEAGIDWNNVGTPGATVSLTGTTVATTTNAGTVTGNVNGNVGGNVTGNVTGTVNGLTATAQGNVRTAVGLASANLDTQLSTIAGYIDTEVASIVTATSAASIRSAVGLASANLDTQIGTLATASALTTVGTNVSTILSRIGAIAGSGTNTILGFFQFLMKKAAMTAPSDIGGTYDNTTDSLEALRDQGDAAWITNTALSIRTAVGMASANLDTQLGAISTAVATVSGYTDDIGVAGAGLTAVPWNAAWAAQVRAAVGLASANMDTQLSAIVGDTNELQTDWVNGGRLDLILDQITATLGSVANDTDLIPSIPTANQNADALLDRTAAIAGKTPREAWRIIGGMVGGTTSGAGTNTEIFNDFAGSPVATVTVTAQGERTAVVIS